MEFVERHGCNVSAGRRRTVASPMPDAAITATADDPQPLPLEVEEWLSWLATE